MIATPHPSHAEIAIRSLEAGKHVLCEKPIATSVADASRILEAAERSRRVFIALPFDGSPPVEEAKRLLGAGAIGRVSSADAVLAHRGPKHAPWFFDREKAEWGVAADLGIYLVSQLTYLFGPAASVFGRVDTVFPERTSETGETIRVTVDDNVAAVVEWPDGSSRRSAPTGARRPTAEMSSAKPEFTEQRIDLHRPPSKSTRS